MILYKMINSLSKTDDFIKKIINMEKCFSIVRKYICFRDLKNRGPHPHHPGMPRSIQSNAHLRIFTFMYRRVLSHCAATSASNGDLITYARAHDPLPAKKYVSFTETLTAMPPAEALPLFQSASR